MLDTLFSLIQETLSNTETLTALPFAFGLISPDENASASDFINSSEKDATPANDNGRVPKLENDAKISHKFLNDNRISIPAYEDITKDNIVFVSTTDNFKNLLESNFGTAVITVQTQSGPLLTENAWVFNNEYHTSIIDTIRLYCKADGGASGGGTNYGLFTINIYSVNGSNEPDTLLGTSTEQIHTFNDSNSFIDVVFGTPVSISDQEKIAIAIVYETTDDDGLALGGASSQNALAQFEKSGSDWIVGTRNTPYLRLDMALIGGDALISDKDETIRRQFDGIALNDALAGENVVINTGKLFDRLTGIVKGTDYYLGNDGAITTTPNNIPIGVGISTTEIKVPKYFGKSTLEWDGSVSTFTATTHGIFFGVSTYNSSARTFTVNSNGISFTFLNDSTNTPIQFCLPLSPGDTISYTGGLGTIKGIFKPLS